MADEPISALTLFTSCSTADEVEILDVSDTTLASTGTNKRIQFSTLLAMAGVGTVAGGGTGLTAVGSADQLVGVAHTGGALEYKTLTAGPNVTITPAAGSITIAASGGGNVSNLGLYNVMTYGATGSGTTDDTAAIQAALNAASVAGGGCVYLPTGTYMITSKLWLWTGCRLTGDGYSSCILGNVQVGFIDPQEGTDYHPVVEVPASNYGTCVDHIRFLAPPSADSRIYGWHGFAASYSNWVHNCWFSGFNCVTVGTIDPSNSYDNIIQDNIVMDCVLGINLSGSNTEYGNILIGNQIIGATYGISAEWPFRTVISGNRVDASDCVLQLCGTYQSAGQVSITGNTFTCTGSSSSAIILGNSSDLTLGNVKDCVLAGNTIYATGTGNASHMIQCKGIDSCVIADNVVIGTSTVLSCLAFLGADTNNRVTGNSFRSAVNGVLLQAGGAVNNTIAANTFDGQQIGVLLSATATVPVGTEIRENRFLATVTTPVSNNGTGTIISNNGGLTTGSIMHLDGTETITGVKTFASWMTMSSSQVNRTGVGTGNNQFWYIGIQDAAASDGVLFGWSSTNYTTGGTFQWLNNNTPFLYFPPGSTFQFGTGLASTGCVMELSSGGVNFTGPIGVNGATPPAKAAPPGTATSSDAAVINAVVTILRNLGFCS